MKNGSAVSLSDSSATNSHFVGVTNESSACDVAPITAPAPSSSSVAGYLSSTAARLASSRPEPANSTTSSTESRSLKPAAGATSNSPPSHSDRNMPACVISSTAKTAKTSADSRQNEAPSRR